MAIERARSLRLPDTLILGTEELHNAHFDDPVQFRSGVDIFRDQLYITAWVALADFDLIETYDDYPVTSLLNLRVSASARKAMVRGFCARRRLPWTARVTDVVAIHEHLKDDLGFAEVGFAPVTSDDMEIFKPSGPELAEVFSGLKKLGARYLEAALVDRNNRFSNMHQLMTDLCEGTKKALPCGAGVGGLLTVDHEGGLTREFPAVKNQPYAPRLGGEDGPQLCRQYSLR